MYYLIKHSSRYSRILFIFLVLFALLLDNTPLTSAQIPVAKEFTVKAAYLLNFAKFTEWPSEAFNNKNAPLVLGVFGEDYFGPALDLIDGKIIKGRKLVVRRLGKGGGISGCHLLYISPSEERRMRHVLAEIKGQPLLSVSEVDNFAEIGGIINLVDKSGKIRFEVNLDAAEKSGLSISSKLLNLAVAVHRK